MHDGRFACLPAASYRISTTSGDSNLASKNVLAMNSDGSQRSIFFDAGDKTALGPVWSPAGDRVAFALGRFFQTVLGPAMPDIAIVNRDGTGLKLLTDGSANLGFPSRSPMVRRSCIVRPAQTIKGSL